MTTNNKPDVLAIMFEVLKLCPGVHADIIRGRKMEDVMTPITSTELDEVISNLRLVFDGVQTYDGEDSVCNLSTTQLNVEVLARKRFWYLGSAVGIRNDLVSTRDLLASLIGLNNKLRAAEMATRYAQ